MNRVGNFEKVSYEQFYTAMKDEFYEYMSQSVENFNDEGFHDFVGDMYDNIALPTRATSGSAGYDFKAPFDFNLAPGETIKIPTGIRVQIDEGWWLGCLPRSGLGFKYQVCLANTIGVIDADYYNSSNEGHIFLKIVNRGDKVVSVDAGSGFAQGIFIPYGITYTDDADGVRNGGFGSTDTKK